MYGLIESLSELLRIPSISGNEKECKRALDFLLEVGNDFGFKTGRAADGKVGYIEIGEGQETLGVLTHVDVAHPGDISQWPPSEYILIKISLYQSYSSTSSATNGRVFSA